MTFLYFRLTLLARYDVREALSDLCAPEDVMSNDEELRQKAFKRRRKWTTER